jgi:hypothetical protein
MIGDGRTRNGSSFGFEVSVERGARHRRDGFGRFKQNIAPAMLEPGTLARARRVRQSAEWHPQLWITL